jgi:hypothetical protein
MPLPGIMKERLLSFAQAAERFPAIGGAKPSVRVIYFWCDTGILVSGGRVRLECARRGGVRVTSEEAIERFINATSGGGEQQRSAPGKQPAKSRVGA